MEIAANLYLNKIWRIVWYAFLVFFSYLMLLITLQYIPLRTDVAFLRVKEEIADKLYYRVAFFSHVYTGMFILLAGMLQLPAYIRARFPAFHTWCGRVYAYGIILVTGPAGLIMGFYANGGWISKIAFCLLAFLWVAFTYKGVAAAISRNLVVHQNWMYRSYALTLSAISLRLWKWVIVLLFEPRPMDAYHIVSWLGWVGNLLIVEFYIYVRSRERFFGSQSVIPQG
ncbi:DUF2306 domain-containing protein [uncultured Mucilaginibacter sp.]|uniref:DUF2306 domain-containing protein n=1 Tax=uncultured Mucilaginibacter sp. TaxID=797541 RepID=UPI0025DBE70B|nr:DUF2306 domain-containing protein [uncultured Mucilaginibacter sp.]